MRITAPVASTPHRIFIHSPLCRYWRKIHTPGSHEPAILTGGATYHDGKSGTSRDGDFIDSRKVAMVEVILAPYASTLFPDDAAKIDHVMDMFFSGGPPSTSA